MKYEINAYDGAGRRTSSKKVDWPFAHPPLAAGTRVRTRYQYSSNATVVKPQLNELHGRSGEFDEWYLIRDDATGKLDGCLHRSMLDLRNEP